MVFVSTKGDTRTLKLLDQSAVLTRVSERYRYFLVDEFQDTNGLQRELLAKLDTIPPVTMVEVAPVDLASFDQLCLDMEVQP